MRSSWSLVPVVASVLLAGAVAASEISLPVTDAEIVTTPAGKSQIVLPLARPQLLDHVSLGEARLRLSRDFLADGREQRILVLALRAPWSGGDEPPLFEGLVDRLSLAEGSHTRVMDLSNVVRGVLREPEFYGLLITTPGEADGGFDGADAQAILAAVQGATLEISYRRIPPPRPQRSS